MYKAHIKKLPILTKNIGHADLVVFDLGNLADNLVVNQVATYFSTRKYKYVTTTSLCFYYSIPLRRGFKRICFWYQDMTKEWGMCERRKTQEKA